MSSSLMPSRCLTRARSELPCAATSTVWPDAQVGHDPGVPVGQEPLDHVLEALGARHVRAELGVLRQTGLGELGVIVDAAGAVRRTSGARA